MRSLGKVVAVVCFLVMIGCGTPTKQSIMDKAAKLKTKDELRSALGDPDGGYQSVQAPLLGTVEEWKYKCSDGEVVFEIVNNKIKMKIAGDSSKK